MAKSARKGFGDIESITFSKRRGDESSSNNRGFPGGIKTKLDGEAKII